MRHIVKVLVVLMLLISQAVTASQCNYDFTLENWLKSFDSDPEKQKPMLEMLSSCLASDSAAQEKVDYLVVESVIGARGLDKAMQKPFLEYNLKVLKLNALAGFPSSQHNYASLHNADPGSPEFKLIPQSQKVFAYWSKMAASNAEPRAMFNLAVRYADEDPPSEFNYNPALAYTLFLLLKRDYGNNPEIQETLISYADKEIVRLNKILGNDKTRNIENSLSTFDYKILAPK